MWDSQSVGDPIDMWCFALLFVIAVASCNAETYEIQTGSLPLTVSNSRIIGGNPTTIQQYPFSVQVLYSNGFICGGSLLTQRHVLTAAHCFYDRSGNLLNTNNYSFRVGSTFLNSGGQVIRSRTIIIHASYTPAAADFDIAVVLTRSAAILDSSVALTRIPTQGAVVPDNSPLVAVGWGVLIEGSSIVSNVLNEVTVYKIDRATCQIRYRVLEQRENISVPITSNMLCSGILDVGGKDACQGDSGGPVLFNGIQVGITSWGEGCAQALYPGVNVRVSAFTNWINDTVTRYNAGLVSSQVGALTLVIPLLYLIVNA